MTQDKTDDEARELAGTMAGVWAGKAICKAVSLACADSEPLESNSLKSFRRDQQWSHAVYCLKLAHPI